MGSETQKCYEKRLARGDFDSFLVGKGLDIGPGTDPLVAPNAFVDQWDLPQGDAERLQGVQDCQYDFVYSSHCLEHVRSLEAALTHWLRVIKPGGFLYVVVPDFALYEKGHFPSRFNSDHKHTFSLSISRHISKRSNHWHVRNDLIPLLKRIGARPMAAFLEDDNYDYRLPAHIDQTHFPNTLAQICIIAQKESSDDNTARNAPIQKLARAYKTSDQPIRIYSGILGQIGEIVMFTPVIRRLKTLFPHSTITFALSRRYHEVGTLIAGLPFIDRIFVTDRYFEGLSPHIMHLWHEGWPVDLRGEDEVEEQRRHDLVFETRPRSRRKNWWRYGHQVEELAHMIGVPGPIDLQTEIAIPSGTTIPDETKGKIVVHNDPAIATSKAWMWDHFRTLIQKIGPEKVVLLGNAGPAVAGVLDYRGKTTLAQAAAIISATHCYIGIDSGLMWIAGSLQVPVIGLYGTSYKPAYGAIQPQNPRATYIQVDGSPESISPETVWQHYIEKTRIGLD